MLQFLLNLLFLVPLVLLIVTIVLIVNGHMRLRGSGQCTGVIVDFYRATAAGAVSSGEHVAISPVVSYTVFGQTYRFIGKYYSTNMKIGSQVTVLYDLQNPSNATIKTGVWLGPLITGMLTLFFTIAVIIVYILRNTGIL